MSEDARLVQQCLSGDDAAMRALIEQFQQIVFALCFRMLGQREDAEDVSQDVFLRVFRSLHRWDQSRPLRPWILTIAANRCRTALERRARLPAATEQIELLATEGGLSGHGRQTELAEELQRALQTLREDYRLCFVLFYQQELSCEEISRIMDCPEGTVKTWLHRARRELSQHLQRRGITDRATTRPATQLSGRQ